MAQTMVNFRMDEDLKKSMERILLLADTKQESIETDKHIDKGHSKKYL